MELEIGRLWWAVAVKGWRCPDKFSSRPIKGAEVPECCQLLHSRVCVLRNRLQLNINTIGQNNLWDL
jgi:hypothetical protein